MKRLALVAALAATTAVPAFAQSSLQVYGRLNVSIERQRQQNETEMVMQNNASRIGFKGTEDLGGGLKANFLMEHRFSPDTGTVTNDAFWSGDSWVGLSGGFGEVRLGRMTSAAYYATADYVSMHNHDTGTSSDMLYLYDTRDVNKISYTTPNLGGFTAEAQYSLKEVDGAENAWELAANYGLGPLHLGAGYTRNGDVKVGAIRALYELGAFTFGGYYERDDIDGDKRNNFRLAAMYTMGASEFHANVGFAGDIGDVDDSSAQQYTLGYNYNLSKRTKLFAFYTRIRNEDNAEYFPNSGRTPPTTGGDFSSLAVGVRHNF